MPAPKKTQYRKAERERMFAMNYLAMKFNATQAAIATGLPPASAASEASKLLRNPNVEKILGEELELLRQRTRIVLDDVVAEIGKLGFSNLADYTSLNGSGERYIDFSTATREQLAAVSELITEEYTEGRGDDARAVKRTKFKLHDKLGALTTLLRYLAPNAKNLQPGDGSTVINNFSFSQHNNTLNMTPQQAVGEYQKLLGGNG